MKKAVYYILLAVFIGIFLFAAYQIGSYMLEKHKSDEVLKDAGKYVYIPDLSSDEEPEGEPEQVYVDFAALEGVNSDIVAWLYGADTGLNYPIVQTAEEGGEYYLYRDIDGSSNKNGTVFLDWQCSSNFTSQNNLVYGHNMKTGRMFAPIVKYRDQSFYDAHPYMYLYTPNQLYKVNLFAGMVTPHDSTVYSYSLSSDYIKECIANSTFKSNVGTPTGNILTLSTCAYDFDNARYVVMGELVPIDWPSSGN